MEQECPLVESRCTCPMGRRGQSPRMPLCWAVRCSWGPRVSVCPYLSALVTSYCKDIALHLYFPNALIPIMTLKSNNSVIIICNNSINDQQLLLIDPLGCVVLCASALLHYHSLINQIGRLLLGFPFFRFIHSFDKFLLRISSRHREFSSEPPRLKSLPSMRKLSLLRSPELLRVIEPIE